VANLAFAARVPMIPKRKQKGKNDPSHEKANINSIIIELLFLQLIVTLHSARLFRGLDD
jgi:hypothetical protein